MSWKKQSSKTMYRNRYMSVVEEELLTDHGDKLTFGIVRKAPAVWIIAYQADQILLVKQYRYPVDYDSWELPAGHMEHDNVESAAIAELAEETGYTASNLEQIGTFYPAPGHLDQVGHVFVATSLIQGEQKLETAEIGMQVNWFTLKEINQMIKSGVIKDGPTITAFKLFELHLSPTSQS